MDCFAVSLGIGSSTLPTTARRVFRVSFHFGFFQFLMTILGWLLGSTVVNLIAGIDHWVALLLLGWVGVRMIRSGLSHAEKAQHDDPTRGITLVLLSVATSLDALGVGLSLALLKVNILTASLWIGLVTFLFSVVGLLVGNKLSEKFGKRMEIAGGIVLLLIGLRILITHLMG
jgi:putative Mn2+ efflux pump MntP